MSEGWIKHGGRAVLGGLFPGTCFDMCVLRLRDRYCMWFSWRRRKAIGCATSTDGVRWRVGWSSFGPRSHGWDTDVNRPSVLLREGTFHMWYTGQRWAPVGSAIGYAQSLDGKRWTRVGAGPVLLPERPWEKVAVMCPHVLWDQSRSIYRMWYSGGEQWEPNAIGYAESTDGVAWHRATAGPVFAPSTSSAWDGHKVTGCQVIPYQGGFAMFYIGFEDEHTARIGLAWSADGVERWVRHADNPIIEPSRGGWDRHAVYKPYAVWDGMHWLLWYNGRRGRREEIGLARRGRYSLGFGCEIP